MNGGDLDKGRQRSRKESRARQKLKFWLAAWQFGQPGVWTSQCLLADAPLIMSTEEWIDLFPSFQCQEHGRQIIKTSTLGHTPSMFSSCLIYQRQPHTSISLFRCYLEGNEMRKVEDARAWQPASFTMTCACNTLSQTSALSTRLLVRVSISEFQEDLCYQMCSNTCWP